MRERWIELESGISVDDYYTGMRWVEGGGRG